MNTSVYTVLDDDALAALANKGLLRRAQKDVDKAPPEVAERSDDAVVLRFNDDNVAAAMPAAGPQGATCTCHAIGICRHILTGALLLRSLGPAEQPAPAADAPPAAEQSVTEVETPTPQAAAADSQADILALDEAEISRWAGRTVFRQALDDLAEDQDFAAEPRGQTLLLHLPTRTITVRWVAGAGLGGVICSCKRAEPCRHRVVALLLFRAAHGVALPALPEAGLAAAPGAVRTRADLLAALRETLADVLTLGLVRLSDASLGRLQTLAVSAHGVDLPRLEQQTRALADMVGWYLRRDVRADAAALLDAAARLDALARALGRNAHPSLVGEHRSRYYDVGTLELAGLGAFQWRTRSGYAGVSALFWDTGARRWAVWSDSRPAFVEGVRFDPAASYHHIDIWGDAPPQQASRSLVQVRNARRNRDGRLSSGGAVRARSGGASNPATLDLAGVRFDDWAALVAHAAAATAAGLAQPAPLERLVVVSPTAWGEATYDSMRQTLIRPVADAVGRVLPLVMPHSDHWPFAVDTLQHWQPQQYGTWGILGQTQIGTDGLELLPLALFTSQPLPPPLGSHILNVTLDDWAALQSQGRSIRRRLGKPQVAVPAAAPQDEEEASAVAGEPPALMPRGDTTVGRLLLEARSLHEALAEQGTNAARATHGQRLGELAARMRQVGLGTCAAPLDALAAAVGAARHSADPAGRALPYALLHSSYVATLAAEQFAVARALEAAK